MYISTQIKMQPFAPTEYLTPKETAKLLGVPERTLRYWGKKGKITNIKTIGGHRRYLADEVRAIASRSTPFTCHVEVFIGSEIIEAANKRKGFV